VSASAIEAQIAALGLRVAAAFDALDTALERAAHAPPPAEGWSATEIAEHVGLTNRFLYILVDKLVAKCRRRIASGAALPSALGDGEMLERIAEREFRWEAPTHMLPRGTATLPDSRALLREQARRAAAWLAEFPHGEGALHTIRMRVVGDDVRLDLYQFLAFVALHAERHARQALRGTGSSSR
jgi:hypothetical protein